MNTRLRTINADVDMLAADVQALINATAGAAEETVVTARARLNTLIHDGESVYKHLEESAINTVKNANVAVHRHPYSALGIALGVGIALGAIVTRRTC